MDGPLCLVRLNITSLAHRCRSGAVHPIIASEAKQSIAPHANTWIASSLSLPCANALRLSQAMTAEHDFAISRHDLPELCQKLPALSKQRAQGMPDARCTRGLMCDVH
jgi:hypothetical protein